jgi:hypothetical protein
MEVYRNNKTKEVAQIDRLKFEALLSDLSTAFINVPVSEVDGKIEQGLQRIVEFLGVDRSTVWKVSPEGKMICTHSFARLGIKPPPDVISNLVPVWESMVLQGRNFEIYDVDELPESQWREKEYCREQGGIKSIMFLPASVGGIVVGFITFVSYTVSSRHGRKNLSSGSAFCGMSLPMHSNVSVLTRKYKKLLLKSRCSKIAWKQKTSICSTRSALSTSTKR